MINMDNELIIEGNRKIGEFMGAVVDKPYPYNKLYGQAYLYDFQRSEFWPLNQRFYSEIGVKYHSSWEWLMPVIEKIENSFTSELRPRITLSTTFFRIDEMEIKIFDDEKKIDKVWTLIVEYLEKFY